VAGVAQDHGGSLIIELITRQNLLLLVIETARIAKL
jgi:hypothetical protein